MYIFLDCETTGLMPDTHEIIEIAMIVCDSKLKVIGSHIYKVKPECIQQADRDALAINGYTESRWVKALSQHEAAQVIRELLQLYRRHIIVAHNPIFDLSFIQTMFKKWGLETHIPNPIVDTRAVALQTFAPFGMGRTSMSRICFFLQWPKPTHQAEADAMLCLKIMRASKRSYFNNAIRLLISRACDMLNINYSLM